MKQNKYGKKVINWHRQIPPSQIRRQRNFDRRYNDLEYSDNGKPLNIGFEVDEFWNPYDVDCCPCCGMREFDDEESSYIHEFELWLRNIVSPFPPRLPLTQFIHQKTETISPQFGHLIEDRLAKHVDKILNISKGSIELRSEILKAVGDFQKIEVIKSAGEKLNAPDFALQVCLYAPFWIRSPQSWDENSGTDLLEHLFVQYSVPEFLFREWFSKLNFTVNKWICWFILLGQGGSLKRAAKLFNWNIESKFSQYLTDMPNNVTPIKAIIFAIVKQLGGTRIEAARILRNPEFVVDPTEISSDPSNSHFWQETVRWLAAHRDEITDDDSRLILTWAMHEYTESRRVNESLFSWKDRNVRATLERSLEYRRLIAKPWSIYRWQSRNWNYIFEESSKEKWSFVELTSGEQLFNEGKEMNHCVASYAGRYASGHSAIISLRLNNSNRLTIEINPTSLQITQVRGSFNRQPSNEEKRVIARWMNLVVLKQNSV